MLGLRKTSKSWLENGLTSAVLAGALGCSTVETRPVAVLPLEPPPLVRVPHPQGLDLGDLMAIFTEKGAPDPATQGGCDSGFKMLREKTASRDELTQGARELVRHDPVALHWCFYSKLYLLEGELKETADLEERQRLVMDRFLFLTPVARAFQDEIHDTRYLRWAVQRYRKLSEVVFYRRLDLSPEGISALGPQVLSPWGQVRKPAAAEPQSVLEKYGVLKSPEPEPAPTPLPSPSPTSTPAPAPSPTDVPETLPALDPA